MHVESGFRFLPSEVKTDADVVVIAGDISNSPKRTIENINKFFPDKKVIMIAGNHEYYKSNETIPETNQTIRGLIKDHQNIVFLDNSVHVENGVRFIGCTLWTDYDLYGDRHAAMDAAAEGMTDFYQIRGRSSFYVVPYDIRDMHLASVDFLAGELDKSFDGPTVVVIHHLPLSKSISDKYTDSPLNPAFASDLSWLFDGADSKIVIHGHTHHSCDYKYGFIRVICNPHGYSTENPAFNPKLVVEV